MAVWLFLKRIPWQAWALLAILAGLLWFGGSRYRAGVADERSRQEKSQAVALEAIRKQRDEIEARQRQAFDAIAEGLARDNAKTVNERDSLLASVRSGELRLRERFTCPKPGRVSGTATAATGSNDATTGGLSSEDASFLIRLAADADETAKQLTACQETVRGYARPSR